MRMPPLGFNPHLLPQYIQKTTRAALDDESLQGQRSSNFLKEETELLDKLTQQCLGIFDSSSVTKTQKLRAKTFRNEGDPTLTYFRLIGSALPPHPIVLLPHGHSSVPHQRPTEDTLAEGQSRHKRAREAAVDANWILKQSRMSRQPMNQAAAKPLTQLLCQTAQLPSLFVTERARSTDSFSVTTDTNTSDIKCCPVVHVTESPSEVGSHKPRRKRKYKVPLKDRPHPRFFRPMQEWGGKSAGYAMGWRGSLPAREPGTTSYSRDKMHRGVTLKELEKMS